MSVYRTRAFRLLQRGFERVESVLLNGGWAARWAYASGLQGPLEVRTHEFDVEPGLPRPLRMAFLADLHVGPLTDPRLVDRAFSEVASFRPDLVLFGGDFVGLDRRDIRHLGAAISALTPPLGTYAVLGNHDLHAGAAAVTELLQAMNVQVLRNSAARLPAPFDRVVICGLDDPVLGDPDAAAAFAGADGMRVALLHSPEGVSHLAAHSAEVAFSGHTHGGQVCLPGGNALLVPSGCRRWPGGHYVIPGLRHGLVVSRGVGCTAVPLRIGCPSEVHLCLLRSGPVRSR